MSYILDALKKSDDERRRRKPSGTGAVRAPEPAQPVRTKRWRYIIAAALFLNAGLLVWWLRPWQPRDIIEGALEKRIVAQTETAAKPSVSAKITPETIPTSQEIPAPALSTARNTAPEATPAPVLTAKAPSEENVAPTTPATASSPTAAHHLAEMPAPSIPTTEQAPTPPLAAPVPKPVHNIPSNPAPAAAPQQTAKAQAQDTPSPLKETTSGEPRPAETARSRPAQAPPTAPPTMASKPELPPGSIPDETSRKKEIALQEKAADIAKKREKTQPKGIATSKELIMDLQVLTGGQPQTETAAVSNKALRYRELPSQVRDSMPKLSISMLAYSKKSGDRWINVNGSKMREGQEISAGLKVEEITPEGAVFTYHGQRFYKAVIGD